MTRFTIIVAMGLALAAMLAFIFRWLCRQRWREASRGRRASILAAWAVSLVLLVFLEGGLEVLWHERPNQPATAADLHILERADALLADESHWNRKDDKLCGDDDRSQKWSLYCVLEAACRDASVSCEHTQVASQEVRFAIEEVAEGAAMFEGGRMTGFNNRPETRFDDVKTVLGMARERVRSRVR